MRHRKCGILLSVPVIAVVIFASAAVLRAEEKTVRENWYGIYMTGNKLGWNHVWVVETELDGRAVFVTKTESKLIMKRLGTEIEMTMSDQVVETRDGKLVSFTSIQNQSQMEVKVSGIVVDGKLRLKRQTGDMEPTTRDVDFDPEMLPPEALDRFMRSKGREKGTKYSVKVFLTDAPDAPVEFQAEVKGMEDVDILGTKRTLLRTDGRMTVSNMPMTVKVWVDENWTALKMNQMGQFDLYEMPRELAQKEGEIKEVFTQTIITSDKKIENARASKRMAYRLELSGSEDFGTFPTGNRQRITKKEKGVIEIEIRVSERESGDPLPVQGEDLDRYLASTPYLQVDNARIKEIAKEAVGDETDSLKAARLLETWVFKNIEKKNFGVGFATAAEVAKNLEGDCSEHGVLLAALCRAAGIPSRVVGGLVYADMLAAIAGQGEGGFGFHMWTEVYVGEWVAVDATIGHGFADATHIALARSALESESSMFELLPIGKYMGKLKIKVLED